MRKCVILTSIILCLPSMLVAQIGGARPAGTEKETRATVFGGYSYLRNNTNGFNGWEAQGTFNFNRYLGVTADVSGASLTPFSVFSVGLFGGYLSASEQLFVWADRNRQSGQIRRLRTCIVRRSTLKLGSRSGHPDHRWNFHRHHQR